jgi:hypothetical protein
MWNTSEILHVDRSQDETELLWPIKTSLKKNA